MLEGILAYAKDHQVPIICEDGLLFLNQAIKDYHVKDVLEIGTAIGYSALAMASFGCYVDTFERNKEMECRSNCRNCSGNSLCLVGDEFAANHHP